LAAYVPWLAHGRLQGLPRQQQIFVTEALRNETLGFEWIADGLWSVFFGDVLLGRFDEENSQFLAGMSR
jgi:hypothetical protein